MTRGKRTATVTELPDIKVGDRCVITAKGPRNGQEDTVAEVDAKHGVRLQGFGWLKFADVEVLDSSGPPLPLDAAAIAAQQTEDELKTQVDGKDATVVLDGKTGAIAGDEPMIKPPLEDLVRSLANASQALGEATIVKKRANEAFNDAQGAFNAVAAEIVEHYGHVEQLRLNITNGVASSVKPDPEDEDEEDDEEMVRTPVASGGRRGTGEVVEYAGKEGPE